MNVQWPFSKLLMLGVKMEEARKYALDRGGVANVGEEMWLVETRGDPGTDAKQLAQAEMSDEVIGPRPDKSHIIGTITFSHSWPYCNQASFHGDVAAHRVKKGCSKYWSGVGEMHYWSVRSVSALEAPVLVRDEGRKVSQARMPDFGPSEYAVVFRPCCPRARKARA